MFLRQNIAQKGILIFYEHYNTKAKKRQRIIKYSLKHGKSKASRKYKEPLSNIKRWSKRYDGTWQSREFDNYRNFIFQIFNFVLI